VGNNKINPGSRTVPIHSINVNGGKNLQVPQTTISGFNFDRQIGYLDIEDGYLHPNEIEIQGYDTEYIHDPEATYLTRRGSNITFAYEKTNNGFIQYFVFAHNYATPVKITKQVQDSNSGILLYGIEVTNQELFFFNETSNKKQGISDPSKGYLTFFASEITNIEESGNFQKSELATIHGNNVNPNEYSLKAKVIKKLSVDNYLDETFYSYLVEVNIKGKSIEIPLVIHASRLHAFDANYNPHEPLKHGSLINANVILQGHLV